VFSLLGGCGLNDGARSFAATELRARMTSGERPSRTSLCGAADSCARDVCPPSGCDVSGRSWSCERAPQRSALDAVRRLAGANYEAAHREAAKAGLPPPKRFDEVLCLLRAVPVLERGKKVKEVPPAYGFHDAERCARRLHHQLRDHADASEKPGGP